MANPLQPPELKFRLQTLAEKLFQRVDQQPEKQAVGFVFVDFDNTRQGMKIGVMLFSGAFMLLLAPWIIYTGILGSGIHIIFRILISLFGFLLALAGISSIWAVPVKLQALKRANPGELVLPCYPLRLGETLTLTFRRHLKSGYSAKTQGWVWGRLICLEVYMDNRGSGSASFYGEPVWYQDLPTLEVVPGSTRIERDWHIRIPADGTPTIRVKSSNEANYVLWGIDVHLNIPGIIKDDSVFCLQVEPEVV
ncbi:MAG: hypothetical protein LDL41_13720 [Coleofasciculus sp. S288]|nr:hypothetical protein [Coleofasciculus sp. S288]